MPDRRPIKSRNTRWASAVANFLVKSGVSPNAISLAGMFAAIAAGGAFFATSQTTGLPHRTLWLAAAVLCQVRLLANLFDGMVAIARGTASPLGELYNEVPDRISDAAVFIGLGYAAGSQPELGYLAALTSLFTAYIRATAKATGAPQDFCGPMAKPQRMALAALLGLYLAFAPDNWKLPISEPRLVLALIIAGNLVTAARRLIRAAHNLRANTNLP
jgi:phosphatidylglycerophosphate synthase